MPLQSQDSTTTALCYPYLQEFHTKFAQQTFGIFHQFNPLRKMQTRSTTITNMGITF
jgi:hypothetical protein